MFVYMFPRIFSFVFLALLFTIFHSSPSSKWLNWIWKSAELSWAIQLQLQLCFTSSFLFPFEAFTKSHCDAKKFLGNTKKKKNAQIKRHTRWKLRFKRYLVSFFALSRSPRFCFSLPPRLSEWVLSRVFYEILLLVFCSNFYAIGKHCERFRKCVIILFCSSFLKNFKFVLVAFVV